MNERSEPEVIGEFREAVTQGSLTSEIAVTYEVSGGAPGEDEGEFSSSGPTVATLSLVGDGRLTAPQEGPVQLDPAETRQMFQHVASSLDSLVPRTQARFLPDSVVGSVTITVRGKDATLYFLADEGQRQGQQERIARGASQALPPLRELSRRLRREGAT